MNGRPEIYTQEVADMICHEIATTSKSLKRVCEGEGMPSAITVLKWIRENKNDFLSQYARAKEEQADLLTDEMIEIADDGENDTIYTDKGPMENKEWTNRSKLRVETRKWLASKLKPKKYGDKVDHNISGNIQVTGMEIL